MVLIPVVVVSAVFRGVGVVTGPVTAVSFETSPAGPKTKVLGLTPATASVKVTATTLFVRPRQSYPIVTGFSAGFSTLVAGGNV